MRFGHSNPMRRQCQFTVKRFRVNQPQRPPSQHDSVTVWHLGHSRCARTKIGASVVPQYLQRGGSTLAGLSLVGSSDCMTDPELSRRHDHHSHHQMSSRQFLGRHIGHHGRGDCYRCNHRRRRDFGTRREQQWQLATQHQKGQGRLPST